jgi:hypothetical protein
MLLTLSVHTGFSPEYNHTFLLQKKNESNPFLCVTTTTVGLKLLDNGPRAAEERKHELLHSHCIVEMAHAGWRTASYFLNVDIDSGALCFIFNSHFPDCYEK